MQKKLKGALIGYGFIGGKGHAPAYRERQDVEMVAFADICEGRRVLIPEAFPQAKVYSDYLSLLNAHSAELDFIDICTPPVYHAEIALAAFERGVHVLCEKPITVSTQEAEIVMKAAKKHERVFFPCHNYKHAPVVKAIRRAIDDGKIGKPHTLTLSTFRNTHAKGVTEWNTHWRREKKYSGGGIAMDHGSHTFYLTFDWLKEYPTHVTAKMINKSAQDGSSWDTEDNFSITLTFPSGWATTFLTWTAGVRKVIYSVQGTTGAVRVEDDDIEVATMQKTSGPDVAQGAVTWNMDRSSIASNWMDASHVSWFNSLFDQFKNAIEKREYVSKEALEAYRCIQIIETAYRSAQEGSREFPLLGIPKALT